MTLILTGMNKFQRKQYKLHKQELLSGLKLWEKKGRPMGYLPYKLDNERYVLFVTDYPGQIMVTLWDNKRQYVCGVGVR